MTAIPYGPLPHGDTAIGERCPACSVPFVHRDWVAIVPVGPGGEPHNRAAARAGAQYIPVNVTIHWACHTGHDSPPMSAVNNAGHHWARF